MWGRLPGKPYSGRLVYKGAVTGTWYWQCDLHDEEDLMFYCGAGENWHEVFSEALSHSYVCGGTNEH